MNPTDYYNSLTTTVKLKLMTLSYDFQKLKVNELCEKLDRTEEELNKALLENSSMRAALIKIADGGTRITHKIDKCVHGQYGFEPCENCITEYAEEILKQLYGLANHE